MDPAPDALYDPVINQRTTDATRVETFLAVAMPRIERALVARYGLEHGHEAAAEAGAYAVEHWTRLEPMNNPIG